MLLERFDVIILNTGGTLNKRYDKVAGKLFVPQDNRAIEDFLQRNCLDIKIEGLIYKDSLDFTDSDRQELAQKIADCKERAIIVVHGTDTMDKSAAYVAGRIQDKCIVFTGAMVPYFIDKAEASANMMLAIAKAKYSYEEGVFIAMHGLVASYDTIYKDKQRGVFCLK